MRLQSEDEARSGRVLISRASGFSSFLMFALWLRWLGGALVALGCFPMPFARAGENRPCCASRPVTSFSSAAFRPFTRCSC